MGDNNSASIFRIRYTVFIFEHNSEETMTLISQNTILILLKYIINIYKEV